MAGLNISANVQPLTFASLHEVVPKIQCLELEWWAYLSFVFSFFILCLCLNYVVKKMNEAKIEERFIRMLQKASTTQSTQVCGPLIAVETTKTPQQRSPPGISLVFNKEDNKKRTDPYNLILKPPKDWKIEVPSSNAVKSMDTINVISITSDDRVAAKASSSHLLTEKVLVKKNEFGRRVGKENSTITTKSDSYVTELITVKKNEYGHIAGISTLPVTRKDSKITEFVSENETRKISPYMHIDNVIQDVTAKESADRKESSRIKAEGSTSNEPNDSVAENVPITNIYAGRIVSTNARSVVEFTVKNPTREKSKEEIDTGCSIKKSVENILSKIANLRNKNVDLRREKSTTETYAAKQSSSLTESRHINEKSYNEKKESSCTAAKETSSHSHSDRVGEILPIKKRDLGPVPKETSLHARIERHVKDFLSVKMSVTINTDKVAPRTRSDITISKYFPIKRNDSGSTVARKMDPLQEPSHTRSCDNVAELSLVNIGESSRITVKAKTLREIVLEKYNAHAESDILVKKMEDSTVVADTSRATNDGSVKGIPLTDTIKALIEDENIKDIMLHNPSSSSKQ